MLNVLRDLEALLYFKCRATIRFSLSFSQNRNVNQCFHLLLKQCTMMLKRRSQLLLIIIQTLVSHALYTNILLSRNMHRHVCDRVCTILSTSVVKESQSLEIDNIVISI